MVVVVTHRATDEQMDSSTLADGPITCPRETGGWGGVKRKGRGLYMEVGCNRLWRGEEPVALETASMELARLAGEPLTVG